MGNRIPGVASGNTNSLKGYILWQCGGHLNAHVGHSGMEKTDPKRPEKGGSEVRAVIRVENRFGPVLAEGGEWTVRIAVRHIEVALLALRTTVVLRHAQNHSNHQ